MEEQIHHIHRGFSRSQVCTVWIKKAAKKACLQSWNHPGSRVVSILNHWEHLDSGVLLTKVLDCFRVGGNESRRYFHLQYIVDTISVLPENGCWLHCFSISFTIQWFHMVLTFSVLTLKVLLQILVRLDHRSNIELCVMSSVAIFCVFSLLKPL